MRSVASHPKPPHAFGDPGRWDAALRRLTVRSDGVIQRRADMYGFGVLEDNPGMTPPTDEAEEVRWRALNALLELRGELLGRRPESVEPLAD